MIIHRCSLDSNLDERQIAMQLNREKSKDWVELLGLWENASQMRKWTQKARLVVSERITKDLKDQMQDECNREGRLF